MACDADGRHSGRWRNRPARRHRPGKQRRPAKQGRPAQDAAPPAPAHVKPQLDGPRPTKIARIVEPSGVVIAEAAAQADIGGCVLTLDRGASEIFWLGDEKNPLASEVIDLPPATVHDFLQAANANARRVRPADDAAPVESAKLSEANKPASPAAIPKLKAKQKPLAAKARNAFARPVENVASVRPRRTVDFIHRALRKRQAMDATLRAQQPVVAAPEVFSSALPPAIESPAALVDRALIDREIETSLPSENGATPPVASRPNVALPPQDLERRSRYWKIVKRMLAARGGPAPKGSVVALFVAAGKIGAREFSLIELAGGLRSMRFPAGC